MHAAIITFSGAATDIASYAVFDAMNGADPLQIASAAGGTDPTTVTVLVSSGEHSFTVQATDASGNISPLSAAVSESVPGTDSGEVFGGAPAAPVGSLPAPVITNVTIT